MEQTEEAYSPFDVSRILFINLVDTEKLAPKIHDIGIIIRQIDCLLNNPKVTLTDVLKMKKKIAEWASKFQTHKIAPLVKHYHHSHTMSNSVHTQFHVSEDIHTILAEPLDALDDNLERWNEVIQDIIAFYISIDVSSNWHAHGKDMSQFIRDIYSMMK